MSSANIPWPYPMASDILSWQMAKPKKPPMPEAFWDWYHSVRRERDLNDQGMAQLTGVDPSTLVRATASADGQQNPGPVARNVTPAYTVRVETAPNGPRYPDLHAYSLLVDDLMRLYMSGERMVVIHLGTRPTVRVCGMPREIRPTN